MGGHESGFSRLRAPVVFMRAVAEDSSLFNFSFDDEHDGAAYGACIMRRRRCLRCLRRLFHPVHGLQWAHCCDELCIMDCNANHFTLLMPHAAVGGALDAAVTPTLSECMRLVCNPPLERCVDFQLLELSIDDEQEQPQPPTAEPPAAVDVVDHGLHAAPATAGEAVVPMFLPPPAEEPLPPELPYVLPQHPRSAAHWQRSIWAYEENLPAWTDGLVDLYDDHGTLLPDLDATAGRHALGLNALAWTAPDAHTVVFMLHDFLSTGGERWSELAFATQLPVLGLHTPPGLLSQFLDAVALSDDAADSCSMSRIASQYLQSVHSCLSPAGGDCIIASYLDAAPLATELASQLRAHNRTKCAISVLICEEGDELAEHPLGSAAYQALHSVLASAVALALPSWHEFSALLGVDGSMDEHLCTFINLRPPGVAKLVWQARAEHAVRGTLALFEVAKTRFPCSIEAGHRVWLNDKEAALSHILMPRRASFVRLLRIGRESALRLREAGEDGEEDAGGAGADEDAPHNAGELESECA